MRIAIIGQQDFGKATLEAFLNRGDTVAAVFCAPEKGRPDPLRVAAEERGVPVHQFPRLTDPAALEAMRQANAEVGVMAYVTQFAPQDFCSIPKFGTIQFHPSLLPLHRGASSMSWAIICGRTETGFSIFRPTDGLDEGPVILMRSVPIEPEDTLGSLYFGKIFPMGVAALVEVAEQVVAGKAPALAQYEPNAGYEGIIRDAETRINWANHVDIIFNLIRGCRSRAWCLDHGGWQEAVRVQRDQAHRAHLLRGEGQEARRGGGDQQRRAGRARPGRLHRDRARASRWRQEGRRGRRRRRGRHDPGGLMR